MADFESKASHGGAPRDISRRLWLLGAAGSLAACADLAPGPAPSAATSPAVPGGTADRQAPPPPTGSQTPVQAEAPVPKPDFSRFRIPGEFEPQRAQWLSYSEALEDTTAALAAALLPHTPLVFLVGDDEQALQVRRLLDSRGLAAIAQGRVRIHVDPLAMFYLRDSAVFATGPSPSGAPSLAVVDFRWNLYGLPGWCGRRYPRNSRQMARCAADTETTRDALDRAIARLAGAAIAPSALYMEGGGIESNGRGLLVACEALVRIRNPKLSRAELERLHLALPGVKRVVWLPEGLAEDPHMRATITGNYVAWGTGGHTDEFVRFADERTVLLAWPDDAEAASHPVARLNRRRMQRNFEILSAATDLDGRPLRVLKVPMPRIVERRVRLSADADRALSDQWTADFFPPGEKRKEGETVIQVASASYLNFVAANGVIVLPDYLPHGTPADVQGRVQQLFEQAFPGRVIRFVDSMALNWLGGGLHCATLHEPLP